MVINHIKEFLVVTEVSTFQEAADRLFISQSSLSKHIALLEQELGVSLFDRVGKRAVLNEYGKIFAKSSKKIIKDYECCCEAISIRKNSLLYTLSLGSIPAMVQYKITDCIVEFSKKYPNYTVAVTESPSDTLCLQLDNGNVELAFLRYENGLPEQYSGFVYSQDSLAAVVSKDNPLAQKQYLHYTDLAPYNLMLLPTHTNLEELCLAEFSKYNIEPRFSPYARRVESIIDLAGKDMGIGLILHKTASYNVTDKVVIKDVYPKISSSLYICHLKGASLSHTATAFIECLRKNLNNGNE